MVEVAPARVITTKVVEPVLVGGENFGLTRNRYGLAIQRGDGRTHTPRDLGSTVVHVDGIPLPNIVFPFRKFLLRRDLLRRADAINERAARVAAH